MATSFEPRAASLDPLKLEAHGSKLFSHLLDRLSPLRHISPSLRSILFLFSAVLWTVACGQEQPLPRERFSKEEVQSDLQYLYTTLQSTHVDLFVNAPKKRFDEALRSMSDGITDSLTYFDAHRLFQRFTALSGLAHCNAGYPFNEAYGAYIASGGELFPLDVRVEDNRMWVLRNHATGSSIEPGDEVITIAAVPTPWVLEPVYAYLSGENERFKNTLIDLLCFPRIWWLLRHPVDEVAVGVRKPDGRMLIEQMSGVSAAAYEEQAAQVPSVFNSERDFSFMGAVAYLRPGPFEGRPESDTTGVLDFVPFIDSCFNAMKAKGTERLLIDLRGNAGGANTYSDAIVSWFADRPFWFCSKFVVRTSAITKQAWVDVTDPDLQPLKKLILDHADGELFEAPIGSCQPKPEPMRFKGKVFVLVDRFSYSNAVTTAAMIQDYGFGEIIGEPTADVPTTYAAVHTFTLPNTRAVITYPKAYMVRPNGDGSLNGVTPDQSVPAGSDALQFALRLAGQ